MAEPTPAERLEGRRFYLCTGDRTDLAERHADSNRGAAQHIPNHIPAADITRRRADVRCAGSCLAKEILAIDRVLVVGVIIDSSEHVVRMADRISRHAKIQGLE